MLNYKLKNLKKIVLRKILLLSGNPFRSQVISVHRSNLCIFFVRKHIRKVRKEVEGNQPTKLFGLIMMIATGIPDTWRLI